jgi:hypothetical protein
MPTTIEGNVQASELVVIGRIADVNPKNDPSDHAYRVTLREVDYLKGSGPEELEVASGSPYGGCGLFDEGSLSEQFVLFLGRWSDGQLSAGICDSSRTLTGATGEQYIAQVRQAVQNAGQDNRTSPTQAESEHDDLPVYIILPAAFLVPLAVLVIWTFVIRPKGGDGH